uniref:Ground-like domain-containing protein n=1 Tax=Syphacia muris TaxID=451379 RepID=A0A0N5AF95_9BILA
MKKLLVLMAFAFQTARALSPFGCLCLPFFPQCLCPTSNPYNIYQTKVNQYRQYPQSSSTNYVQQYPSYQQHASAQQYNWQPLPEEANAPPIAINSNQIERSSNLFTDDARSARNNFFYEINNIGLRINCNFQQPGDCCDPEMQKLIDDEYIKNNSTATDSELVDGIRTELYKRYSRNFEIYIVYGAVENQQYGNNLICKLDKSDKQILTYLIIRKNERVSRERSTQRNVVKLNNYQSDTLGRSSVDDPSSPIIIHAFVDV